MPNATALALSCNLINKAMRELIRDISELENSPEDEAAYHIISDVSRLAHAMENASRAGQDDRGNDVLNAYEAVANAIRAAKGE